MTMRYYANVTWIDDMLGRTMAALRQKGLLDNAVIVYTSDHGEMLGERYYRFNKYCLYDASVRVPLILSGTALPEDLRQGNTDDRPVDLVDIMPTVLNAAGIKPVDSLPGMSLFEPPVRIGGFSALHERDGEAAFMWRTKRHKLILVFNRKGKAEDYTVEDILTGEFYDLEADPREWDDLYGKPEVAALQAEYQAAIMTRLEEM